MSEIRFYVNGKEKFFSGDPRMTLLNYLRSNCNLTGTKLGCGEGGCGACTVMLSSHRADGEIRHLSANACLTPVCALDGVAVTTVEGIGGMKHGLHPIQTRLAAAHGSQCGFCTPGIVMAIYAKLRANPDATPHELEESMDGNLCRCTGYRPIIDAVRSLSNQKGLEEAKMAPAEQANLGGGAGGCCGGSGGAGGCPCKDRNLQEGVHSSTSEGVEASSDTLEMEMRAKGMSEPIFPPALMNYKARSLKITSKEGFTWYQPTSLSQLLDLKARFPNARLVVGNTEVGIETKFKNMKYPEVVSPSKVPELLVTNIVRNEGVVIGASVTINDIRNFVDSLISEVSSLEAQGWPGMLRGLLAIKDQITWFASNQIRNVAAIGGNIVTASPIGDLNPMLISQGAIATIVSSGKQPRKVPLSQFFLGYRKVDLAPDEILQDVFIPFTKQFEFCIPLKQARRREDDISIVTGCFRVHLKPNNDHWVIEDCHYGLGGMAPTPISATGVNSAAQGMKWSRALLTEKLYPAIEKDLVLPTAVPGGQAEYRTTLVTSFLFRSFLAVTMQLQQTIEASAERASLPAVPVIAKEEISAAEGFVTKEKPRSRGQQNFYVSEGNIQTASEFGETKLHSPKDEIRAPVGQPVMHKSALLQVTGEAAYTNDTSLPSTALHAMLVMSTRPHAKLLGVDISSAEALPGFHSYLDHRDVTGHNQIGAVFKDEEVFAVDTVRYVGMVIGVVLADTHDHAVEAARAVKVEYEDLPAYISIEEAIAAKSFYADVHEVVRGDIVKGEKDAEIVVSGTSKVGAQEHFYLETNATIALPTEHGHLEIIASTQNLSKTQAEVAAVTGLAMGQVVCKTKRLGGGFGGKEERSIFITVTAALAAHLTGRPVSILIERDVDMAITGQRHSFQFDYKAGCTKEGKLVFLDAQLYSNAGWSLDLSQAVMDRALLHSDNCYKWPNQRVKGWLCKTNQPSHTAFRGFGGPQGMMLTEFVMQHLSKKSGVDLDTMRVLNFYKDEDSTHFGQVLKEPGFHVPRIFESMQSSCNIASRKEAITSFNASHKWKKRGLCQLPTKFGINFTAKFLNQGGALVHVYSDGTVLISHGGTEMGQGLHTKMVQVAAQCFGIHHSLVTCLETATTSVANSSPTAASASTDLYGMAVLNACEQIKARIEKLREDTKKELNGTLEELSTVQEKELAVWKKTINTAYFSRINLSAQGFYAVPTERCGYDWTLPPDAGAARGHPFNYFTQGVATCEVEIDCLTGDSHVIRADIVMDVGKSINPAIDIGQIEGAFTQGYGWSTMEEMIWGDSQHPWLRQGNLFTKGPGTYKIPAFNDVPRDFRVHLYDTSNKYCVHSSKAVGEPPFFLGSAVFWAIMSAVQAARAERGLDQSGEYFPMQCPATSERIRMACADDITGLFTAGDSAFQPKGSW